MIAWELQHHIDPSRAAADGARMAALDEFESHLIAADSLDRALDVVIVDSVRLMGGDFGSVQLLDDTHALRIARAHGFSEELVAAAKPVTIGDTSTCGLALQRQAQVIAPDLVAEPGKACYQLLIDQAGVRSIQSTPMITSDGVLVGMMNTHFRRTGEPPAEDMLMAGLYARQAAEVLRRLREPAKPSDPELSPRLKNLLALILGLARRTLRGAPEMKDHVEAFAHRLAGLARAHAVVDQHDRRGADITTVIDAQLAGEDATRVRRQGPALVIAPDSAYALGLIVHELGANARRHGALSIRAGRVKVEWAADPATGRVELVWTESGGPPVQPPETRGFGSSLIENLALAGLARAEFDYRPQGLVCRVSAPIAGAGY